MREVNGSQREGVGLDNGERVEHGYGVELNDGTAGDRRWSWHTDGRRRGDESECNIAAARQSSRGCVGSGVEAEGRSNREIEAEEDRRYHCHPSSALVSMMLAQP